MLIASMVASMVTYHMMFITLIYLYSCICDVYVAGVSKTKLYG